MAEMSIFTEKVTRHAAWRFNQLFGGCPDVQLPLDSWTDFSMLDDDSPLGQSAFLPYYFISASQFQSLAIWHDGIPVTHTAGNPQIFNPLFPAYYGLVCINEYHQTREEQYIAVAKDMARALMDRAVSKNHVLRLEYTVPERKFLTRDVWISGLTQGLAVLLNLTLSQITGETTLQGHAEGYLGAMMDPVSEGGALETTVEDYYWIEEYPGSSPSHVLNGFIFSFISVIEAERAGLSLSVSSEEFEKSLLGTLHEYLCGKYLRYDRLTGKFCSPHYLGLHTLLFAQLEVCTNNPVYATIARKLEERTKWGLYFDSIGRKPSHDDGRWLLSQFGKDGTQVL